MTKLLLLILLILLIFAASKPACRALIRWRAAKLPLGEDAERAREELEGFAEDFSIGERAEFTVGLLIQSRIEREIADRGAARQAAPRTELRTQSEPYLFTVDLKDWFEIDTDGTTRPVDPKTFWPNQP